MGSHSQNYNTYKVYKYTSPSKKIYIGQTYRTLDQRAGKNGIPVLCVETGIIYESAAEAGRLLNFGNSNHIPDSIRNPQRYKTVDGYHWKKVTKEEYKKYIEEKQE